MSWTDRKIEAFNEKHDLDKDGQFRVLFEEFGELYRAISREDSENIREECADICFVARSISLLADGNPTLELAEVTHENLQKNTEKKDGKVTKDKGDGE